MTIKTIVLTLIVIIALILIFYLIFKKDIDQNRQETIIATIVVLALFALVEILSRLIHPIAGPIFFCIAVLGLLAFWIYRKVVV